MAYYHRYRPALFGELIGQDQVRQILQAALQTDRLSHAYLFAGSRGTGKTTTARLLAKAINCPQRSFDKVIGWFEPCNACPICHSISEGNCLDVLEIDGASNRGIEEIRQLQEQARFRPQQTAKKIFIIDEVHMLTKEAFNALLKTLEEPPDHLLFILATTEVHKLPPTIVSRCQRFDFLTPTAAAVRQYLDRLVASEQLKADPVALDLIADLAHGSFRDGATLLEQLAHQPPITAAKVSQLLGLPEPTLVQRYLLDLAGQADRQLPSDLRTYFERGGNPAAFIDSAFQLLAGLISKGQFSGQPAAVLGSLTRVKQQQRYSPVASLPVLVAITQPAAPSAKTLVKAKGEVSDRPTAMDLRSASATDGNNSPADSDSDSDSVTVAVQVPPVSASQLPATELADHWQKTILELSKQNFSSLVAILRTARPLLWQPPNLKIGVQFRFHADQLSLQRNRVILESTLSNYLGVPVLVEAEVKPLPDLSTVAEEVFNA